MSTTGILTILFILELVIVGFGLSGFLFMKLRKLKREIADREYEQNHAGNGGTLYDLLEEKITETRNKIAEKSPNQSEQEHKAENAVLEQRIEYLKLEKELLDDSIDNDSFWSKLFNRLSTILTAIAGKDTETDAADSNEDGSSLRRRLSKYRKLLSRIIQEFRDYRNQARKLADSVAQQTEEQKTSEAIMQSLAEFNKTHEETRKRLDAYQQDLAADTAPQATATDKAAKISTDFTPAKASEEEIKRLQQIIGRQYDSLDELKKALRETDSTNINANELSKHLEQVEHSQKELQTCVEVLEMENQRLAQELSEALQSLENADHGSAKESKALRRKNSELESELSDTLDKLKSMEKDYHSLQNEFMRIYNKDK